MEELDISDTSDTEVTEEVYATLNQMKFEQPYATNVALAMVLDDEISEALILSESSFEDEDSEDEKENLGNVHIPAKTKGIQRKASDKQIEDFIELIDDGVAIKDAALATGIKLGSAYNYRKQHVMDPNNGVPYRKKRDHITS
ncbi:hypothetical protein DFQ28_010326 [Apophysomyces sp. BC1034]|nr:hypothetical protein DFQ30_010174 [Apophysomyces sp. BC1015]KAG0177362.1 hypothetical protein DFQ29_004935 [Apophysomyces sp. BC1021]KAG0192055.1 hypothetical protein DFQ28_010326 [Apophysomyces sp. BC1034]